MDKKLLNNDDICDVYEGKICDNCGDCLEMQGIDTKAIKISDIAKEVKENKEMEEALKKLIEEETEAEMNDESFEEEELTTETWEEYLAKQEEYEDAFDHIEYLEDIDLNDDLIVEEMTEEVFPGVRKLKIKK
ncbi:hypothetical protein [Clostridium sp.]|uniref:hypothetical protein n=1 Tax=Clostridium sp. TaxID=1506 RepID=UPI00262C591D|nr:hypothetical protein [Clostridium sp.]